MRLNCTTGPYLIVPTRIKENFGILQLGGDFRNNHLPLLLKTSGRSEAANSP